MAQIDFETTKCDDCGTILANTASLKRHEGSRQCLRNMGYSHDTLINRICDINGDPSKYAREVLRKCQCHLDRYQGPDLKPGEVRWNVPWWGRYQDHLYKTCLFRINVWMREHNDQIYGNVGVGPPHDRLVNTLTEAITRVHHRCLSLHAETKARDEAMQLVKFYPKKRTEPYGAFDRKPHCYDFCYPYDFRFMFQDFKPMNFRAFHHSHLESKVRGMLGNAPTVPKGCVRHTANVWCTVTYLRDHREVMRHHFEIQKWAKEQAALPLYTDFLKKPIKCGDDKPEVLAV
jgi:hypothetical protein